MIIDTLTGSLHCVHHHNNKMAARTIHKSKLLVSLCIVYLNCVVGVHGKSVEHVANRIDDHSGIGAGAGGSGDQHEGSDPIQVFIVPHSHMDVGWVYTVQVCL